MAALDDRPHPEPGDRFEVAHVGHRQLALGGRGDHRLAQGVLGGRLRRRRQAHELVGVAQGLDLAHRGSTFGEGAGLVQRDVGHRAEGLERLAGAHDDALVGRPAGGPDDGQGRGDAYGAGVAHDEHAQAGEDRPLHVGTGAEDLGADRPAQGGQGGHDQHGGRVDPQHPVDQVQDPGLEGPGVLDVAHDLGQEALGSDCRDADQQRPRAVDRTANDRIALGALDRDRLAGDHGLVDGRAATGHVAVNRDALTGAHSHQIAQCHLGDRDLDLLVAPAHPGGVGLEVQQALDRLGAAGLDQQGEPLREDVVVGDQHGHGEERGGGEVLAPSVKP